MFKIKIFSSIIIFSCLLIITSIIKNETRDIEKKIFKLNKKLLRKRDLNETQLDYSYLTSPSIIELKLDHLDNYKYLPMEYSNIFLVYQIL